MSAQLQVFLLLLVVFQILLIIRTINNKKLSLKFGTLWIVLFGLLLIPILVPAYFIKFANLIGFEASSNMFFILAFFFLVYLIFILFMNLSILEEKNKKIIQELSILKEKINKEASEK